jgi:hypothetical protein
LYNETVATRICAYIADQKSLRWIAKQKGMPSRRTILYWLERYPEFERQYNRARAAAAESFVSEMVEMADQAQGMTGDGVRAMQLRIDTRKWVAAKLLPKKYGERVTHGLDEDLVLNLSFGRRQPVTIDATPVPVDAGQ